jgi:hypothetical protein
MEIAEMFAVTRLGVKRLPLHSILLFMVVAMALLPLFAAAGEDSCAETGIYIGNQTTLDVWYKRNDGPCSFWPHDHILILKPDETLVIYRDMTCQTLYCSEIQTYDDCQTLDVNQNCRVRILPDCTLSDM